MYDLIFIMIIIICFKTAKQWCNL